MFERILKRFRERIRTRQFVMTLHALEEMEGDELSIYDIEHTILTGSIIDRQRMRRVASGSTWFVEGALPTKMWLSSES
jgi:hypothetical protein